MDDEFEKKIAHLTQADINEIVFRELHKYMNYLMMEEEQDLEPIERRITRKKIESIDEIIFDFKGE